MEPMQVIQDRMDTEGKQMQQLQQLQQQNQQDQQEIAILQKQVEMLGGHLQESQQQNMQSTADTLQHLNTGQQQDQEFQLKAQQQAHQQQIERANTMINAAKVVQMGQKQAVTK
jgi:glucan-binding YG repeat protein